MNTYPIRGKLRVFLTANDKSILLQTSGFYVSSGVGRTLKIFLKLGILLTQNTTIFVIASGKI
jgi:hypothetical protein